MTSFLFIVHIVEIYFIAKSLMKNGLISLPFDNYKFLYLQQLHETLIEELNKQIYAAVPDQSVSLKRSSSYRRGSNLTKQLSDPECKQTSK